MLKKYYIKSQMFPKVYTNTELFGCRIFTLGCKSTLNCRHFCFISLKHHVFLSFCRAGTLLPCSFMLSFSFSSSFSPADSVGAPWGSALSVSESFGSLGPSSLFSSSIWTSGFLSFIFSISLAWELSLLSLSSVWLASHFSSFSSSHLTSGWSSLVHSQNYKRLSNWKSLNYIYRKIC